MFCDSESQSHAKSQHQCRFHCHSATATVTGTDYRYGTPWTKQSHFRSLIHTHPSVLYFIALLLGFGVAPSCGLYDFRRGFGRMSYKIVLVGNSGVGKSRLLERFTRNDFSDVCTSTYGVEYASKRITVNEDTSVDLNIWDTAGQPKYRAITTAYYTSAAGVLLVYDISNYSSFEACAVWLAVSSFLQVRLALSIHMQVDLFRTCPKHFTRKYGHIQTLIFRCYL